MYMYACMIDSVLSGASHDLLAVFSNQGDLAQ